MMVSILIVSWNGRSDLEQCLYSLRNQTDRGFEIIVIDNHSSDGTQNFLLEEFPEVLLVEMSENLGFAEGCNRALSIASGDWIATLNQDTTVEPEWLAELKLHAISGDPLLGMLQSRILFMERPDKYNSTGIILTPNAGGTDRDFNEPVRDNDQVGDIFCPTAGAALYRRKMLDQVCLKTGYFDRTFFMYWEDLDLGWRCRLAGWSAIYVPTATVYHRYQGSSRSRGVRFAELQCRKNRLRSLLKNGSFYLLLTTLNQTIRDFLIGLRHGGLVAIPNLFTAIYDGLRQRRDVTALASLTRRELEKEWVSGTGEDAR